jgi:hypothetical protein
MTHPLLFIYFTKALLFIYTVNIVHLLTMGNVAGTEVQNKSTIHMK